MRQIFTGAAVIRIAVASLIGIGCGILFVYRMSVGTEPIGFGLRVGDRAAIERRLSELKTSLALERYERLALSDDLESLVSSMAAQLARVIHVEDEPGGDSGVTLPSGPVDDGWGVALTGSVRLPFPGDLPQSPAALDQFLRQQQLDRFIAAGIAPGQAQVILDREDGIELEALRARHAAVQSGATPQEVATITPLSLLRSDLGDSEYAKYLDARGRPNSINVREVIHGSSAETAGMKPGDEIIVYNGQRVFDATELTLLSYEADAGTTVQIQVIREGQTIPMYVAAGPIGINGGGPSAGF